MFQTFRNAWKIPELKNRLLFTLAILVVYRLGCAIPVPFVTSSALTQMFSNGNMLAYLDMMSGGALARCTLFALGVTPYINASIIVQLLTVAIPSLENIAKEPDGQQKLQQITRYAGGIIALIMSLGYYFVVRNMGALKYTSGAAGIFTAVVIIATFTAGAQLITWCGEQIDDKGIGNGLSLLIFSSIVSNWSSLYTTVAGLLTRAAAGESQFYIFLPLLLVLALVVIVFIVIMTNAERRITIQYAKRVVGRKQMGGQNSYLPLKLNMSGVMPIIFASALVSIPGTIGSFMQVDQAAHPFWYAFFRTFNYTSPLFMAAFVVGAALWYKKPVQWQLVVATVVGFAGVVEVLQPEFHAGDMFPALIGLASGLLSAVAYMQIRELTRLNEPDWRVVFYFTLFNIIFGAVTHPIFDQPDVYTTKSVLCIIVAGSSATLAQIALTKSYGSGNLLLSSILSFSAIVFAVIMGVVIFGDPIELQSLLGIAIIIFAGVCASVITKRASAREKKDPS